MPGPKIGERPYLAPPKTLFWGPILGLFWHTFGPILIPSTPYPTPLRPAHYILYSYSNIPTLTM